MNTLMRRDPFDVPNLNRLVHHLFADPTFGEMSAPSIEEGNLALDVSEDEKAVIVRASLPGFRKEDIEVEAHDGVLTIKAQRNEEHETKSEKYYRKERRMNSASRRIALPAGVIGEQTQAELKDGVLTLRMPKEQRASATKIRIG
jgi:HSP20 family protein